MQYKAILKYSLLAGAVYFLCVALAHAVGYKIPGLFIYYNVTSYQYQDSIISFLAFGWSAFFYAGSKTNDIIKPLLFAALVAIVGLINITLSTDFSALNQIETATEMFWLQIILLTLYLLWLSFFAMKLGLLLKRKPH